MTTCCLFHPGTGRTSSSCAAPSRPSKTHPGASCSTAKVWCVREHDPAKESHLAVAYQQEKVKQIHTTSTLPIRSVAPSREAAGVARRASSSVERPRRGQPKRNKTTNEKAPKSILLHPLGTRHLTYHLRLPRCTVETGLLFCHQRKGGKEAERSESGLCGFVLLAKKKIYIAKDFRWKQNEKIHTHAHTHTHTKSKRFCAKKRDERECARQKFAYPGPARDGRKH